MAPTLAGTLVAVAATAAVSSDRATLVPDAVVFAKVDGLFRFTRLYVHDNGTRRLVRHRGLTRPVTAAVDYEGDGTIDEYFPDFLRQPSLHRDQDYQAYADLFETADQEYYRQLRRFDLP